MSTAPLRTALVYDFDGTLAPGSVQEHDLLARLEVPKEEFWPAVKAKAQQEDADEILVYMQALLEHAEKKNIAITRAMLKECGAKTPLFEGVEAWFDRIDAYADERNLSLAHYVVSSGNEEIIRGASVAAKFREIFACKYIYRADGAAYWPGVAINYTTKTQYLFRINKGIENHWDSNGVNRWVPMQERPVPFSRMLYLGDGDTDIPSMKMVRHQGGHSIAVFDPTKWQRPDMQERVYNLIAEDRANFVVPADYREGSQLDITVKGVLGRIARDEAGYRG